MTTKFPSDVLSYASAKKAEIWMALSRLKEERDQQSADLEEATKLLVRVRKENLHLQVLVDKLQDELKERPLASQQPPAEGSYCIWLCPQENTPAWARDLDAAIKKTAQVMGAERGEVMAGMLLLACQDYRKHGHIGMAHRVKRILNYFKAGSRPYRP